MAKRSHSASSRGETELINRIRRWLGGSSPPPPQGIGDDCAVVGPKAHRHLLTVDPIVAGKHFTTAMPPAAVGAKLLKRNLSDIAAMGGTARHAVIALALPPGQPEAWLAAFFRGLARCAREYGVEIVGGDCSATEGPLVAALTLLGDAPPRPLTRSGARPGDLLYVTGNLGGSILGHHWRFEPRIAEGRWLAQRKSVHAALDLSDGLGKDLRALLPSGVRAVVDGLSLPISRAARKHARRTSRHPIDCAINDGEDYELLFAAAPHDRDSLTRAWRRKFATRLACIGRLERIRDGHPVIAFSPPLPPGISIHGHVHFR